MVPVEDTALQEQLGHILRAYLEDNQKAHVMRADGSYRKVVAKEEPISAQATYMDRVKNPTDDGQQHRSTWEPILEFHRSSRDGE